MSTTISPNSPPPPVRSTATPGSRIRRRIGRRATGWAALTATVVLVAGCGGGTTDPATSATTGADASVPTRGPGESATTTAPGPDDTGSAPGSGSSAVSDDLAATTPPPLHPSVDDYPAGRVLVEPGDGAEPIPVAVRVADTAERRRHGLKEVEEVPDGAGMWFTYDTDSTGRYYMLDTRTDLDIAWVDVDGTIVATETMAVCVEEPCERYDPQAAYRSALEVAAGWLAANDVEVGDRITRDDAAA